MKYEIKGENLPVLIVHLDKGEKIITEQGAMSWMSDGIDMSTSAKKGLLAKMFTSESIFRNEFTAVKDNQFIALSSSFPGNILAFDVKEKSIIAQKKAFLASSDSVNIDIHFQKKLGVGLFGGEGFIMQRFSGEGNVFLEIDGSLFVYDLHENESLTLDTGYLAATEDTVKMDIVTVKGVKNALFGGEGLFHTKVTGPGKVWIQSMPLAQLEALFANTNNNK